MREGHALDPRFTFLTRGRAWWVVITLSVGCGGVTQAQGSGGAAGSGGIVGGAAGVSGGQAGSDAGGTGGTSDGGWTECSTPDWLACGVPECPAGRPGCSSCLPADEPGLLGTCGESLNPGFVIYKPADGNIFVATGATVSIPLLIYEVPFSAGVFIAAHGQTDRLAYADLGVWTGEPIPAPTDCKPVPGTEICGGYCGGCSVGNICTGRSPLHPYGICVPTLGDLCSINPAKPEKCQSGEACFVFQVEEARQPMADARGFCLPTAVCQASAAGLPGGGFCK